MAVAYSSKNRTKTFIFSPSSGSGPDRAAACTDSSTARTRKTEALFAHFIGIFCIFFLQSLDYMVVFMYNGYKRFSFILA